MEFTYNLYDVTLELNFTVILQEICDAFPDRTLAEEKEAVRYLNSEMTQLLSLRDKFSM